MSGPRIDLWDPSPEGSSVLERLRREGFDAHAIDLAGVVLTRADLLVMAADARGALDALRLLREEGSRSDVPVVLLGRLVPHERRAERSALAAETAVSRPVELDDLVRAILSLLGDSSTARASLARGREPTLPVDAARDAGGPARVSSSEPAPSRAREPTLQLLDASTPSSTILPRGNASALTPRPTTGARSSTGSGSRPGTGPLPSLDAPEPPIAPHERAELAPWLEDLLRAVDRRVFPEHPSLVLHFPAAKEPPEALVPNELLDVAPLRIDEPSEDPIDAFTYVGGPIVPGASVAPPPPRDASADDSEEERDQPLTSPEVPQRLSRAPSSAEREQTTGVAVPVARSRPLREGPRVSADPPRPDPLGDGVTDSPASGPSTVEARPTRRPAPPVAEALARRGEVGAGGALRLLWRLADERAAGTIELELEGGPELHLELLDGEPVRWGGSVARTAVARLRARGDCEDVPRDEPEAERVLARLVERGALRRYDRARLLRESSERLLELAVASRRAAYVLEPRERGAPEPLVRPRAVVQRSLRAALIVAAMRAISPEDARARLGPDPFGVELGPEGEPGLAKVELPFELSELLAGASGASLDELVALAPEVPALPSLIYALELVGLVRRVATLRPAAPNVEARGAAERLVTSAASLAQEADYFAILGVSPGAARAELASAHAARRAALEALSLPALGLAALVPARSCALDALDEALEALSEDARRAAYAAALVE